MADTTFVNGATLSDADWFNDVNRLHYTILGDPATASAVASPLSTKTTVASATTPDIFATTVGQVVDYTGTITCTGFVAAPQAGATRRLVCAGAAVFTAGANMLIDGVGSGSNLTCAANDIVTIVAVTTTQFRLIVQKYVGFAALGANADITSMTALTSINGHGLPGVNRIMNGDQRKATYGTSATITAGAALAYILDHWWAACTGANVAFAQVAGSGANRYLAQFTGAASVTAIKYGQRMETAVTYDLNNSNNTFSVLLANSLLTTVTWTAYYANTTDTFGTLGSPTKTQIATGTFTVNSTIAKYSATIAVPAAATTGIEIILSVGAQTSGTWQIGQVQWESGSTATVWTPYNGIFGGDDAACGRYRRYVFYPANAVIATLQAYNTTSAFGRLNTFPEMFAVPTVIASSALANFQLANAGGTGAAVQNNFILVGMKDGIYCNQADRTGSGLIAGDAVNILNGAGATFISAEAEIP